MSARRVLVVSAAAVLVGSITFAILLPEYACDPPHRLQRDIPPPAGSPNGWICQVSDTGYVPDSRLAGKIVIAVVGVALAGALGYIALRTEATHEDISS